MCGKATVLMILYSEVLLNLFISSDSVLLESLGFSILRHLEIVIVLLLPKNKREHSHTDYTRPALPRYQKQTRTPQEK